MCTDFYPGPFRTACMATLTDNMCYKNQSLNFFQVPLDFTGGGYDFFTSKFLFLTYMGPSELITVLTTVDKRLF